MHTPRLCGLSCWFYRTSLFVLIRPYAGVQGSAPRGPGSQTALGASPSLCAQGPSLAGYTLPWQRLGPGCWRQGALLRGWSLCAVGGGGVLPPRRAAPRPPGPDLREELEGRVRCGRARGGGRKARARARGGAPPPARRSRIKISPALQQLQRRRRLRSGDRREGGREGGCGRVWGGVCEGRRLQGLPQFCAGSPGTKSALHSSRRTADPR